MLVQGETLFLPLDATFICADFVENCLKAHSRTELADKLLQRNQINLLVREFSQLFPQSLCSVRRKHDKLCPRQLLARVKVPKESSKLRLQGTANGLLLLRASTLRDCNYALGFMKNQEVGVSIPQVVVKVSFGKNH
jgi:hypothetical protein